MPRPLRASLLMMPNITEHKQYGWQFEDAGIFGNAGHAILLKCQVAVLVSDSFRNIAGNRL